MGTEADKMKANFFIPLISALLVLFLIPGILPGVALAADNESENNGNSTINGFPDLVIDTFNYPEKSATNSHETIEISVKNQGTAASEAAKLNLYIGEAYLREWDIPQLSPGQNSSIQSTTWIPMSEGLEDIKAIVDETNLVEESDENNNQQTSTISVAENAFPDLIIEDISPEVAEPLKGKLLNVTVKVKNQGTSPSGEVLVRYYINGTQAEKELQIPVLLAGEDANAIFSLIPEEEGPMEIKGFVDSGTSVYEGNETNNEFTKNINVKAIYPDLAIDTNSFSVNPQNPEPGTNTTFTATIRNKGPGDSSRTALSYSINGSNETASGVVTVPALAPGQVMTGTFAWTPKNEGRAEIKLELDKSNAVSETDENNNQLTQTVTIAKKAATGGQSGNSNSGSGSSSGSNSGSSSSGSKSKSSSKSGMGSGVSQEPASNVAVKELSTRSVISGYHIKYDFPEGVTCITFIEYDAKKTFKKMTTSVEVLKNKSTLVKTLPSGRVYNHVNIWVGEGGAGKSEALENGVVGFKVEKTWIKNNRGNEENITLQWYDKEWKVLETQKTGEDKNYVYFKAKTLAYSSFAITENTEQEENKALIESKIRSGTGQALKGLENNTTMTFMKKNLEGKNIEEKNKSEKNAGIGKILIGLSLPLFMIIVEFFVFKKRL
jgi:PGF-pre-PGF domain-containing protein